MDPASGLLRACSAKWHCDSYHPMTSVKKTGGSDKSCQPFYEIGSVAQRDIAVKQLGTGHCQRILSWWCEANEAKPDKSHEARWDWSRHRNKRLTHYFQYEIYLFECILVLFKEASANKSKDKKDKTRTSGPRIRNRNTKLQLKGRIFITDVTDIVSLSKPGKATQGSASLRL